MEKHMARPFQVGIKGVICADNKVLLLKFRYRDGNLHWDLPGGRVDDDEDIATAFTREVAEELPGAREPRLLRILHAERAPNNFDNGEGLMWIFYLATARIDHLNGQTEHEGYEWVDFKDIPALTQSADILLPPAFVRALDQLSPTLK